MVEPGLFSDGASPLDLPVQEVRIHCVPERPIGFPPRPGATPGTTLAGAFKSAVHAIQPDSWLLPQLLSVLRHNRMPVAVLRAPDLEPGSTVGAFTLVLRLRGRRALRLTHIAEQALLHMGKQGLLIEGGAVPFAVLEAEPSRIATLEELAGLWPQALLRRALLEFATPTLLAGKARVPPEWLTPAGFPLARLVGNFAYELAALDLADRGAAVEREECEELCGQARDHVAGAIGENLKVVRCDLRTMDMGTRRSASNGRNFPQHGLMGTILVEGDFVDSLPWLYAWAYMGAGQATGMGYGWMRLWMGE